MPRRRVARTRVAAVLAGRRLARPAAARLGQAVAQARRRRHLTQANLGRLVGLSTSRIGQVERGQGSGVSTETWFAFGVVLDLPLRLEFGRDALQEPADAPHLALEELMLRLARTISVSRFFELPTRPTDPALSVDVGWRDDRRQVLILNECWNSFGSINASLRSTHRKVADAEGIAGGYRVASCWIVRDTRRNREIVGRYPEVFETAFPGSSTAWVKALTDPGAAVPDQPGLVWCDLKATRLFAWRRPPAVARRHTSTGRDGTDTQ